MTTSVMLMTANQTLADQLQSADGFSEQLLHVTALPADLPGPIEVIILDAELHANNLEAVIKQLRQQYATAKILVVGPLVSDAASLRALLRLGVSGYLLENELVNSLDNALQSVRAGKVIFSPAITELLLN